MSGHISLEQSLESPEAAQGFSHSSYCHWKNNRVKFLRKIVLLKCSQFLDQIMGKIMIRVSKKKRQKLKKSVMRLAHSIHNFIFWHLLRSDLCAHCTPAPPTSSWYSLCPLQIRLLGQHTVSLNQLHYQHHDMMLICSRPRLPARGTSFVRHTEGRIASTDSNMNYTSLPIAMCPIYRSHSQKILH